LSREQNCSLMRRFISAMALAAHLSSSEVQMKLAFALTAALALTGCASNSLYKWGGYENMLYAGYKEPAKMEAMKTGLESHISDMEKSGLKVAPGLYAELGTLYLQAGSADKAVAMYAKERDAWPESKGLMSAMIQNLERRQQARLENNK
jgi:hypothetical protein